MILKFISALVFFIMFIGQAHAVPTPIYDYYIKEGKRSYERGDEAQAIGHFNRALMVDASRLEAIAYLQKLGVDIEDIQSFQSPSIEIAKLNQAIKVYKDKMAELEEKNLEQELRCEELEDHNRILCETVKEQHAANDLLAVKLTLAQEAKKQKELADKQRIEQLRGETEDQGRRLELNERLSERHIQLLDKTEEIVDEKQEKINQLSKDVELVKSQAVQKVGDYEKKIAEQDFKHDDEVLNLKKELVKTKEERVKDNRLNNEELKRAKNLLEKTEEELNTRLAMVTPMGDAEVAERLKKNSKLLREKDKHIAQLKEKLAGVVKDVNFLQRHAQSSNPQEILFLKAQLKDIEDDLNKKNDMLQERDQSLSILQDRLNETKERLGFVEDMVEERDSQIKALEKELKQVQPE